MATLTIDKSGNTPGYNVQWYDGKRRTIYLGGRRYTKKTAERVKEIVETLLYYKWNGIIVPDKATAHWLRAASDDLKAKLAKAELLTVDTPKTCQMLWETFLKHKTDIKPATIRKYHECRTSFFEVFLPSEAIGKVTPGRLLEWKISLLEEYAEATVAGLVKNLKAVLNWAVRQEWLTKNPMADIPRGSFRNRENDRIITMDEYGKLLDACPNQEWQTIIALARIGGLRCPSELRQLRWSDVGQNRFTVRSPKTGRHHAERIVPLFPELRIEFDKHDKMSEFVIMSFQDTSWNLYDLFQEISEAAGIGRIKCPFVNMHRSKEVLRRWGSQKESLWIGHSERVMGDHYFQLSDEDYLEVADM